MEEASEESDRNRTCVIGDTTSSHDSSDWKTSGTDELSAQHNRWMAHETGLSRRSWLCLFAACDRTRLGR